MICLCGGGHVSDPLDLESRTASSCFTKDTGPGFLSVEVSSGVRNGHGQPFVHLTQRYRGPAKPAALFQHSSSTLDLQRFQ